MAMLLPPAWQNDSELDPGVRAFHRYHAGLIEPWDGPAGVVFTDGRVVGAALDRNGLASASLRDHRRRSRSLRVGGRRDPAAARRAGAPGKLGPGELLAVDAAGRGVELDKDVKRTLAARRPYLRWLAVGRRELAAGEPVLPPAGDLRSRQVLAGYTREDLTLVLRPAASNGHEPISSMGDDSALPPLAGRARPLYTFFRQRFAQVTNPPIDHLRERSVMSLQTLVGPRAPLLEEGPDGARLLELESFFLYPSALPLLRAKVLDATFGDESLATACSRLSSAASRLPATARPACCSTMRRPPRGVFLSPRSLRSPQSTVPSSRRAFAPRRHSSSRATSRARCTTSHA